MPATMPARPDTASTDNEGHVSAMTSSHTTVLATPEHIPPAVSKIVAPLSFGLIGSTTAQAFSSFGSTIPRAFYFSGSATTEPFRFLDLPRDIRLLIYDNLFTRTHIDITLGIPGRPAHAKITLVIPDPIPPIHLTCKLLSNEAASFLKARILRMSVPRAAPRLIIHAGPIITLLRDGMVLDEMMGRIRGMIDGINVPMSDRIQDQLPMDMLLRGQMVHDLLFFTKRAGLFMRGTGSSALDWADEEESLSMKAIGRGASYRVTTPEQAQGVSGEPRDDTLRVVVLFGDGEIKGFNMQVFFDRFADMCDDDNLKASLQTFVGYAEALDLSAGSEFVCFNGEMDKKIWDEEWA